MGCSSSGGGGSSSSSCCSYCMAERKKRLLNWELRLLSRLGGTRVRHETDDCAGRLLTFVDLAGCLDHVNNVQAVQ